MAVAIEEERTDLQSHCQKQLCISLSRADLISATWPAIDASPMQQVRARGQGIFSRNEYDRVSALSVIDSPR